MDNFVVLNKQQLDRMSSLPPEAVERGHFVKIPAADFVELVRGYKAYRAIAAPPPGGSRFGQCHAQRAELDYARAQFALEDLDTYPSTDLFTEAQAAIKEAEVTLAEVRVEPTRQECADCNGHGGRSTRDGNAWVTCDTCDGSGLAP
jgi:hypothetical protein